MQPTIELHPALSGMSAGNERAAHKPQSWVLRIFERLAEWHERKRQRRHLQTLDDRLLHDIGLSRADVDLECAKHFWRR